jgi:PTH1 family peptidyl-tRNA hydrolase
MIMCGGFMKLIVGLGNPGKEYTKTRHNIGFMVIDGLLNKMNIKLDQKKFNSLFVKTKIATTDVIIAKPLTFMNLSGEAVSQLANFFRIDPEDILIIHDDFDLPLGKLRLRNQGTGGSHNGMKNIILHLNTSKIPRIRVGIDKDRYIEQKDYVLGKFKKDELDTLQKTVDTCIQALMDYPKMTFVDLMTKYNTGKDE